MAEGRLTYRLKMSWRDATTHLSIAEFFREATYSSFL